MKKLNFWLFLLALITIINVVNIFAQEESWFKKGQEAINHSKYEDAIKAFTKVIEINKNNKEAVYNRGLAYLYLQRLDEAMTDFSSALTIDSTYADALNNRGLLYYYNIQYDFALDDFNKAIKVDKNFTEAYINRGSTFIDMKNYKDAEKDLKTAIKLNPKNPSPYQELGRMYYKQKKYSESIENFTKTIKFGIKNSKIFYNRGNAYFNSDEYENAIKDYSICIKLDSTDNDALNNRAMSYDKLGKTDLALQDRKRLGKIAGNEFMFIPVDSLIFVKFSDSTGSMSVELPVNWYKAEYQSANTSEILISPNLITKTTDSYASGVKMTLIRNMFEQYNVKGVDSLIEFWKGSNSQNTKEYHEYRVISQKMLKKGKFSVLINKVIVQYKEEFYPLALYEYILAGDNELFYAYFQSPEKQYYYFKDIFEKAIETVIVK